MTVCRVKLSLISPAGTEGLGSLAGRPELAVTVLVDDGGHGHPR